MTREEKIQRLNHFCGQVPCCDGCPIYSGERSKGCVNFGDRTDAELDVNLLTIGIDPATDENLPDPQEDPDGAFPPYEDLSVEELAEITADNVNHPQHYELPGGLECFDVMLATHGKEAMESYCLVNAFKYLFRCKRKNGNEDVEKARWYLNKWHELREGAEE